MTAKGSISDRGSQALLDGLATTPPDLSLNYLLDDLSFSANHVSTHGACGGELTRKALIDIFSDIEAKISRFKTRKKTDYCVIARLNQLKATVMKRLAKLPSDA